jgi:integrase/recombinase XerD
MHSQNELTLRIVGKLSKMYPDIDQPKVRDMLQLLLGEYTIEPMSTALVVTSDIQDRIIMYLATKKLDGLSDLTIYNYKLHLVRFSNCIRKNVKDIKVNDIRMYLAAVSENLKSTSLCTEISILKSFFNWLEIEEYIEKNPMKKIQQPKVEKRMRKSLTVEELELLRESCNELRERALLEFLYVTGARLNEAVNVNISDISFSELSLRVIGKGNKEREVYLSPKAKIHINKYLESRTDNCEALFVTERKPIRRLGNRAIQRIINKIGEKTGLGKRVFPHLMRHTMATLTLNNGADITTIQKLLGHTDPATTQIYASTSKDRVQEQHKKHLIQ